MSRIDDLIAELCPSGVELRSLGETGEFIRGSGLQKKDLTDEGVAAMHYGEIHTYYGTSATVTKSFVADAHAGKLKKARFGDLVIATTSEDDDAVAKAVAWLGEGEVAVSSDAYVYRHKLDPAYVAYFFQSDRFQNQKKRLITGTKVRRVSGESLSKIRIPVPPPAIQRQVATILTNMEVLEAELEAELKTELGARRRQYAYYRDSLFTFKGEVTWATLKDTCLRVTTGGTPLVSRSAYYERGMVPWLRTQEVRFADIHDTDVKITEKAVEETSAKWIPANCVIVAISGATAARSAVNKIPLTTNQHCCNLEIDPTRANYRYVFHWVSSRYEDLKALGHGARSDLNAGLIKSFPIALPSLAEQERIAATLDRLDGLMNELSIGLRAELNARRLQYEHYRDRLFAFTEAA